MKLKHKFTNHPFARLHLYAMEHVELFVLTAFAIAFMGRLMVTNPALVLAMVLIAATVLWQTSLPLSRRASHWRLAVTALLTLLGTSIFFAGLADAQTANTLGGMASSLQSDASKIYSAVIYGFYGGGLVSTGIGVNNGIKKSKGDQQITTGHVLGYGLGGPALGGVGYIMQSAAGSMGMSSSNLNSMPTTGAN